MNSLRDKRIIADVFLTTGLVALASAGTWVAIAYARTSRARAAEALVINPTPRGAAVGWRVEF